MIMIRIMIRIMKIVMIMMRYLGEEVSTVAKGGVVFPVEVVYGAPIGCLKYCHGHDQ